MKLQIKFLFRKFLKKRAKAKLHSFMNVVVYIVMSIMFGEL